MAEGDYSCPWFEDRVLHGGEDMVAGSSVVADAYSPVAYSLESHTPSQPGRSGNKVGK